MQYKLGAALLLTFAAFAVLIDGFGAPIRPIQTAAEGTFERTLNVSGPVDLRVSTGSGDIAVRTGGGSTVRIVGRIRVNRRSEDPQGELQAIQANPPVEQQGNEVRIGRTDDSDRERMRNVSISYEIVVPSETELRANSGSGDLTIVGIDGPIDSNSGSGDIELDDIGGDVEVHTGSGDIIAMGIAGSFDAHTGSGDVELDSATAGDVAISTGSGDIDAAGVRGGLRMSTGSGDIEVEGEATGDWRLTASSGGITIRLPSDAAFDLEAETSSGGIDIDHPLTTQGSMNRVRGQVRGGGRIELKTSSGTIRIR